MLGTLLRVAGRSPDEPHLDRVEVVVEVLRRPGVDAHALADQRGSLGGDAANERDVGRAQLEVTVELVTADPSGLHAARPHLVLRSRRHGRNRDCGGRAGDRLEQRPHADRVGLERAVAGLQVPGAYCHGRPPRAGVREDFLLRVALHRDLVTRELDALEAARHEGRRSDEAHAERETEQQEAER